MNSPELKKTALNDIHRQMGARMVDFAGWDMPVQYAGPLPEHLAVRTTGGLFDVSHMGEIELRGRQAVATLQRVTSNDAAPLVVGQCQYSALTTPAGTFIDDILVYRTALDSFFLCVNASNQDKDFAWIEQHASGDVEVLFRSPEFSQLAVQGPRALEVLQVLTDLRLDAIQYYAFATGLLDGVDMLISRTGYTGEDGFELYFDPRHSEQIWTRILEAGRAAAIQAVGLAARNTLRLEAGMALYGHDIDDTTTVLEANLGRICKLGKGDFIGREALARQREEGVPRKLVGFEMLDRGIARDGYPVQLDRETAGKVTSGSLAPYLKKNIGLVYLPAARSAIGTDLDVIIRGEPARARVVATPFYKRANSPTQASV